MGNAGIPIQAADTEIISDLRQDGARKRIGEDRLFGNFAYFIREGMRKHSLTEDEAFDAYSDAILSAIEKIVNDSFEGRSSLKTWLYRIFQNKCVDLLRKKTSNKQSIHQTVSLSDMLFQISDSAKSVIQELIDRTDWAALKQRLHELGENCRQLLSYSAEGSSDKQIALALGYKTAEVAKTSRLRCLEKLRRLYSGVQ